MALTEEEEDLVIGALGEGLGVEDVALRFGWRADVVRAFVFSMPAPVRREIYRRDE